MRFRKTYNNNFSAGRQSRFRSSKNDDFAQDLTHFGAPKKNLLWKKVLLHPFTLLLWTGLCIAASISLIRSGLQMDKALEQKSKAAQMLEREEMRGKKLLEELDEAQTQFFHEKTMRDELNLQKPGEQVLQLPTTPNPSPSPDAHK